MEHKIVNDILCSSVPSFCG